jgi:hypothetical protein
MLKQDTVCRAVHRVAAGLVVGTITVSDVRVPQPGWRGVHAEGLGSRTRQVQGGRGRARG